MKFRPTMLSHSKRILAGTLMLAWLLGCGVNAGNPDSSGGGSKSAVISLELTDAPIDDIAEFNIKLSSLDFVLGSSVNIDFGESEDPVDLLDYRNGNTLSLIDSLSVDTGVLETFYLHTKPTGNPIQVTKDDGTVASVAILNASGDVSPHLSFHGNATVVAGSATNFIVDVDLRNSLSSLDNEFRQALGLDDSYQYILRQEHSFHNSAAVGSLTVSGLLPEQLLCLTTKSAESAEDCTSDDHRSAKAGADGLATILAIPPGEYLFWISAGDGFVLQSEVTVVAGVGSKIVAE